MTLLHRCSCVHAEVSTSATGAPTLYIGFRNAGVDDFQNICDIAVRWMCHEATTPFYLHLHHYDGDLLPPDMSCLMSIISKLSQCREAVHKNVLATCVQAKETTPLVWAAKNLFLKLYQPVRPFDVVTGDEERNQFFLAHSA